MFGVRVGSSMACSGIPQKSTIAMPLFAVAQLQHYQQTRCGLVIGRRDLVLDEDALVPVWSRTGVGTCLRYA